ncbi:Hypothetical predicted protein [Mytilus galloprovincialis]|uniref:F5/8 type C domain-containing protein n=1 Tax=Mytilus galloprovincialis TaxID=29158 RepID=A0A8B6EYT8_MYTGA|nr:Hypothetical predicted protein [Mytilus galloprovincialis]
MANKFHFVFHLSDAACDTKIISTYTGDVVLSASSEYASRISSQDHSASRGILNFTEYSAPGGKVYHGAWTAAKNDKLQYIQIQLKRDYNITGVITQGRDGCCPQWVTQYRILYGNDCTHLKVLDSGNGTEFSGNSDQDTMVTNMFKFPVAAKCIHIAPTNFYGQISMRVEILGCPLTTAVSPSTTSTLTTVSPPSTTGSVNVGMTTPAQQKSFLPGACSANLMTTKSNLTTTVTSSSIKDKSSVLVSYQPDRAILNSQEETNKTTIRYMGGWSPEKSDTKQYIQVEFSDPTIIKGLVTQGKNGCCNKWVTKYKISYSTDCKTWNVSGGSSGQVCSALFASAVLNELADKALFSKHMHLSVSLKENARNCDQFTHMINGNRESALKTLVTKVGRYNSTPLKIAVSQKLNKFMAHTACQAQLNSIWSGDVAVYTPFWRIGMATFFPILLIQSIGFITMKRKYLTSKQIGPRLDQHADQNQNDNSNNKTGLFLRIFNVLYCVNRFYCAPVTKFFVYMIAYMTFVVIFAIFVLTDLYPLSESPPSFLELATWVWTLSLAIEEIRQILQTNKGSLLKNLKFWAKDVWNIFDITMYSCFLMSVVLRCLLNSDQFYFARMAYAVTLSMFILRSMHFFFIERFIGPKVVMIGRMFGDLGFFIALYALFVFSFGIIYQALLFPNSVSSPWELIKDLVYLPYWQLYDELHLEEIEGKEPTKCTNNLSYTQTKQWSDVQ